MPGSTPATSQLDWLISITAMIVLSWSRAMRDLLKSFGWGIAALHRFHAATKLPFPRRPPHSFSRSPHRGQPFRDRAGTWSCGVHGCFLDTQTDSAEMDRATLSYNPPLERAIFRRLTRAPTLMLHSMPVAGGPSVGQCSPDSSRSQ